MLRRTALLASATLGAAALALLLTGVVTASSPITSPNLVTNGGAELDQGASDSSQIVTPQGWTTTGQLTAVLYGAGGGFPDATVATAINGGNAFFAGGNSPLSTATQTHSVPSSWPSWVRRGRVKAVLSADLGGWAGQTDYATVTVLFLNASGHKLASLHVGPVTSAARNGQTTLLPRTATAPVPRKTQTIKIVIGSTRFDGTYNDGYVDNVSLVLRR